MSKYTTEVRYICEKACGYDASQGYGKVNEILAESWAKIFDFDFEVFDPEYKSVLCQKILKHYYTREIGFETVGLWKLKLDMRMNEIMPYFNQLYRSTMLEFNPLYDMDYRRIHEGSDESQTDTNTVVQNTQNRDDNRVDTAMEMYSDTPQGALTNVEKGAYLTNATKNTDTSNQTTTTNTNGHTNATTGFTSTDEYVDHIVGKFPGKSYGKLLTEYRDAIINVDMMVIEALSDLFMKLW